MSLEPKKILSYRDLHVWRKAKNFVIAVYKMTSGFPAEEKFGLASQMRRAAVSIPSNIAEGRGRRSRKDFTQFLHIALGSASELETQLDIAFELKFIEEVTYTESIASLKEIGRMLAAMVGKLKAGS